MWFGGVEFKVDFFGIVNKEIYVIEFFFDFFLRYCLLEGVLVFLVVLEVLEIEEIEMLLLWWGFQLLLMGLVFDIEIQQYCDEDSRS